MPHHNININNVINWQSFLCWELSSTTFFNSVCVCDADVICTSHLQIAYYAT